jgi:TPR repeat protein
MSVAHILRKIRRVLSGSGTTAMVPLAATLGAVLVATPADAAERRVAFVIGNSTYQSVPQLPNPKNDAQAVAASLKKSGFEVITALDLDRVHFDAAMEKFVRSLAGADLSVFYYSGHGIQVGGDNRIIPIDAGLKSPADLEVETISVKTIMSYMRSNSKVQLVYLDSCRNNPFPSETYLIGPEKQSAAAGVGLAPVEAQPGSLVAFSTQPGAIAVDGTGDKSPFTESMLRQSFKLGVDSQTALTRVTQEVWDATHQKQKPWSTSTLVEPVYLSRPVIRIASSAMASSGVKVGTAPAAEQPAAAPQKDTSVQVAGLLAETFAKPRRVPIGVGQVAMLNDFPVIRAANGTQIEITSAPKTGVMYLDGKALGEGDSIDQNALRKVTFEPSIGSENKIESVEFKVAQNQSDAGTKVVGKIEPFVVSCDSEAGEPLDLQGIEAGKLPNEINPLTAIPACTEAVQQFPGTVRYLYELGRAKLAARDVPGAVDMFQKAADGGHIRAFNQLGYMAEHGVGRAQDLAEANRLFKAAAEGGDPYGMLSYGRNLTFGRGVQKNVPEGVRLLNRAVEMGHTYAMNELGAMYLYGREVRKNPARGLRFYQASLARDDIYAMRNLGLAYLNGQGVAKDTTTALALFKKASDGGHPYAPNDIGVMYYSGNGVKKDLATAMTWYELAAERGDYDSASNLSWIYSKGPKDKRNLDKAVWFASLAVALDVYNSKADLKSNLKALPEAAKKATMKTLISAVGADNLETANDLDTTLAMLARKAWQMRNPRLDLF